MTKKKLLKLINIKNGKKKKETQIYIEYKV